jgi:hypothetical protein
MFQIRTKKNKTMLKNGSGRWTAPIVEENSDTFFLGTNDAARRLGMSSSLISRSMTRGFNAKGSRFRPASREEIEEEMFSSYGKAFRVRGDGVEVLMADSQWAPCRISADKLEGLGLRQVYAAAGAGVNQQAATEEIFVAVVWIDGKVTMRLASGGGGGWEMERPSLDDVPQEILQLTRVVRV